MRFLWAKFVVLATFSEQGNVKQTIERADAFKHMAQKAGVTVKDIYWTLVSRDIVAICDADHCSCGFGYSVIPV